MRMIVNINEFYKILKNVVSDNLIIAIEKHLDYGDEEYTLPQFMLISSKDNTENYSSLLFKTGDDM